jgi:hypothetical protein
MNTQKQFRWDNTEGYTEEDLEILNERFDALELDPESDEYQRDIDHICKKILEDFDSEKEKSFIIKTDDIQSETIPEIIKEIEENHSEKLQGIANEYEERTGRNAPVGFDLVEAIASHIFHTDTDFVKYETN